MANMDNLRMWSVIVVTRRVNMQTSSRKPSTKIIKGLSRSRKVEAPVTEKVSEEPKPIRHITICFSDLTTEENDDFVIYLLIVKC